MAQTFLDKVKSAASNFAANAKAAGHIAAKQSERVKITQVTLPNAYLAMGTDIHGDARFREEFGDRYAKADDLLARIAKLREAQPAPSEPQKLTDRAKATAGHAKDWTTAKALEVQVHSVLRELGKSAFEKHGDQSGPSHLTAPIADCLSRIAALDAEISQISESHQGEFLTPKRVLVGGVAVCGLVVLLIVGSMFSGNESSSTADVALPREFDFSRVDYSKGPEGQSIVTRDAQEEDDGRQWQITEQGYMKGDEFVRHGTVTQWYERPSSNFEGKKRGVSPWFAGKRHGQLVEWYENGKLSLRQSDVHGKSHGICERWYDNGQKTMEVTCSDGKLIGVEHQWYRNGQLHYERHYLDGERHGPSKAWGADGELGVDAHYDHGKRDGTWTVWWGKEFSPKYTIRFSKGRLAPCSKAEFIVAVFIVTDDPHCYPERETFMVGGVNASNFFNAFGSPSREMKFGNEPYDRIWVYSCTDGELEMDALHPHPNAPIAIRRMIRGRL